MAATGIGEGGDVPVSVRAVTPTDRAAWEEVASTSDEAWLGHAWDWNVLIEEGVWGGRQRGLVLRSRDRVVGIVPLHLTERRVGPLSRRILHSNRWGAGGLALARDLGTGERHAATVSAVRAIHETARASGADKIFVTFPPLSRRNLESGDDRVALLAAYGLDRDRSTHSLVLRLAGRSEADLWAGLETRCRTAIRKAERSGVRVGVWPDRALVAERYYALHLETYRRTGARPHPRAYFEAILRSEWSTVFFAEREGRTIAAVNVGSYGGRAVYWTGASLSEAGALGANNLAQWQAIRWLRESGHAAYELGELPREGAGTRDDAKLRALALFKRSFGAEEVPFVRGERVYRPLRETLVGGARRLGRR